VCSASRCASHGSDLVLVQNGTEHREPITTLAAAAAVVGIEPGPTADLINRFAGDGGSVAALCTQEAAMFIQVITGKVTDEEGLRDQDERWLREIRPEGFLGSTIGTTSDGRFVATARFESADAAKRNSDRPEQGAWWAEAENCVRDVEFRDSTDVHLLLGGGSNDATFVQIVRGTMKDRPALDQLLGNIQQWEAFTRDARPDILGETFALLDDGSFFDLVYFRSEAEAREGERKELTPEQQKTMDEWMRTVGMKEYFDLNEPRLV
jgi:hypothetical protein